MSKELNMLGNVQKEKEPIDMTFIPKNVENADDYKKYVVRIFKRVPIKHKLIGRNVFTDNTKTYSSGFRLIAPWMRTKLVYIGDTQIDYPVYKFMSSDGVQILVDYTLNLRISNIRKFEFDNKDPLAAINQLTEDIMRIFVANHTSDELLARNFSLRDVDTNNRYAAFADKYGLTCSGILFKCDVPQSLKDDFEKQKAQERENQRALSEAETRKKIAKLDADAIEIKAGAEARSNALQISEFLGALTKNGKLSDEVAEILKTQLLSKGNAQVIANLGSNGLNDLMATILAGINSANTNSKSSSSDVIKKVK